MVSIDMDDLPKDVPQSEDEFNKTDSEGVRNISAIQGKDDAQKWTAADGARIHGAYENEVDKELTELDYVDYVESEYPVTVKGENGDLENARIDTLVEHDGIATLIDYKTNDMQGWTESDVTCPP